MIAELMLALKGDDKVSKVIAGNAGYILVVGAEEVGKIAHTLPNPADCLWAFAFSPGISFVSY